MSRETPTLAANDKFVGETVIVAEFLDEPSDESFTGLYQLFTPRLIAFYRARNCERSSRRTSHNKSSSPSTGKRSKFAIGHYFARGFSELRTMLKVVTFWGRGS